MSSSRLRILSRCSFVIDAPFTSDGLKRFVNILRSSFFSSILEIRVSMVSTACSAFGCVFTLSNTSLKLSSPNLDQNASLKLNPPLAIKVLNASSEPCVCSTSANISINACCRTLLDCVMSLSCTDVPYLVLNSSIAACRFSAKAKAL